MIHELKQAAQYWAQQIAASVDSTRALAFERELLAALQERYTGHWYEEHPIKGQAYRSIMADYDNCLIDAVLVAAATRANIADLASLLPRYNGVRMWVDPGEVSVEPLRGRTRGREQVLYQRPLPATASRVNNLLSVNATPYQGRRSPPLSAAAATAATTAAAFNTRGLYTAADHERLLLQQQQQEVYLNQVAQSQQLLQQYYAASDLYSAANYDVESSFQAATTASYFAPSSSSSSNTYGATWSSDLSNGFASTHDARAFSTRNTMSSKQLAY
jgi:hypothetical protein